MDDQTVTQTVTFIYYKYGVGYATSNDASSWHPTDIGAKLNDTWEKRFLGYYNHPTSGIQIFDAEGHATAGYAGNEVSAKIVFTGDKTLFARWASDSFTVKFIEGTATTEKTCTFGSRCYAPGFTGTDPGKVATWKCDSGCNAFDDDKQKLTPGEEIPDPKEGTTKSITFKKQETPCPKGYYCTGGIKYPCPAGTSTASTGSTEQTNCGILLGGKGTQFCDKSGQNGAERCFYLTGTGIIQLK